MAYRCCVPNCKKGKTEVRHYFKFPDSATEPERRADWVAKVRRNDWKPGEKDVVWICELHFRENDIIRSSTDSNPRRKRKKNYDGKWNNNTLKRPRLRKDAFPSVWPGSDNLSEISSPRSTNALFCCFAYVFLQVREWKKHLIEIKLEILRKGILHYMFF